MSAPPPSPPHRAVVRKWGLIWFYNGVERQWWGCLGISPDETEPVKRTGVGTRLGRELFLKWRMTGEKMLE